MTPYRGHLKETLETSFQISNPISAVHIFEPYLIENTDSTHQLDIVNPDESDKGDIQNVVVSPVETHHIQKECLFREP